jgi:hypothetical protein
MRLTGGGHLGRGPGARPDHARLAAAAGAPTSATRPCGTGAAWFARPFANIARAGLRRRHVRGCYRYEKASAEHDGAESEPRPAEIRRRRSESHGRPSSTPLTATTTARPTATAIMNRRAGRGSLRPMISRGRVERCRGPRVPARKGRSERRSMHADCDQVGEKRHKSHAFPDRQVRNHSSADFVLTS